MYSQRSLKSIAPPHPPSPLPTGGYANEPCSLRSAVQRRRRVFVCKWISGNQISRASRLVWCWCACAPSPVRRDQAARGEGKGRVLLAGDGQTGLARSLSMCPNYEGCFVNHYNHAPRRAPPRCTPPYADCCEGVTIRCVTCYTAIRVPTAARSKMTLQPRRGARGAGWGGKVGGRGEGGEGGGGASTLDNSAQTS